MASAWLTEQALEVVWRWSYAERRGLVADFQTISVLQTVLAQELTQLSCPLARVQDPPYWNEVSQERWEVAAREATLYSELWYINLDIERLYMPNFNLRTAELRRTEVANDPSLLAEYTTGWCGARVPWWVA